MTGFHAGLAALVTLGIAAACDKGGGSREPVAPNVGTDAVSADRSDRGDENHGSGSNQIAIRDDCDPRDPAWRLIGDCVLRRGDVTVAEFNAEMNSTLAASVVGHQAWRNDPSYPEIERGKTIRVRNEGGRVHTFTEVAMFGGGKIPSPDLNKGLVTAPACPGSTDIAPGGSIHISGLAVGNHRFQCCIHPWMRALIKVHRNDDHRGSDEN